MTLTNSLHTSRGGGEKKEQRIKSDLDYFGFSSFKSQHYQSNLMLDDLVEICWNKSLLPKQFHYLMHLQSAKWTRKQIIMRTAKKNQKKTKKWQYLLACRHLRKQSAKWVDTRREGLLAPLQATLISAYSPMWFQTCPSALCNSPPLWRPPLPIPHLPTLAVVNPCPPAVMFKQFVEQKNPPFTSAPQAPKTNGWHKTSRSYV